MLQSGFLGKRVYQSFPFWRRWKYWWGHGHSRFGRWPKWCWGALGYCTYRWGRRFYWFEGRWRKFSIPPLCHTCNWPPSDALSYSAVFLVQFVFQVLCVNHDVIKINCTTRIFLVTMQQVCPWTFHASLFSYSQTITGFTNSELSSLCQCQFFHNLYFQV